LSATSEPVLRRETAHDQAQQSRHEFRETGPLTILRRGNCDPFDAFAISIDAKANEMMTFLRRSIKVSSIEGGASRTHWYSYSWETSMSFLYDKLTALAQFAHIAVGMHPDSSSMSHSYITKALSYKARSMVLVRARVTRGGTTGHSTYYAICMLLLAEIYCRNFSSSINTRFSAGMSSPIRPDPGELLLCLLDVQARLSKSRTITVSFMLRHPRLDSGVL